MPAAALAHVLQAGAGGHGPFAPDRVVEVIGVVVTAGPGVDPRTGAPVWLVRLASTPDGPPVVDCLFDGPEGVEHLLPMLPAVMRGRPDGSDFEHTGRVCLRGAVLVHPRLVAPGR
jgi:hypothetical protein